MDRDSDEEWAYDDGDALRALAGVFGVAAPAAALAVSYSLGLVEPEMAGRVAQAAQRVEALLDESPWPSPDPIQAAIRALAPVGRELASRNDLHVAAATAREALLVTAIVASDALAQLRRVPLAGPPTTLQFHGGRFTDQVGGTMRAVPSIVAALAVERGTTAMWCAGLDPAEHLARWGRILTGETEGPEMAWS